MDAQQFLKAFGHVANAPGGVDKLRDLVLQLAIQGRLVHHNEGAGSSQQLLMEVGAIRSKLIAEKKLPRDKSLQQVSSREVPAGSPQHWAWARFGEVWQLLSGRDLAPNQYSGDSADGIPYVIGASNIVDGRIDINRWTSEPVVISQKNDLLITCKGTIGKTAVNMIGDVHIARQIMAIRNFSKKMDSNFLKIWLDGFVGHLTAQSKSMIPGFSRDDLFLAVYPVPPLAEQVQIVVKVNELIALCDKLETQQKARRKLQNALRQATLQAVASATSPHDLQITWARLAANFGRLFHAPEDVIALKGVILDLAMSGHLLSPEYRDTSSGESLIATIAAKRVAWSKSAVDQEHKEALTMLKKLRTQKLHLPDLPLPERWSWATLLQVSQAVVDCHNKTAPYVTEGIHLIRTTDIRNGQMDLRHTRKVSEKTYEYWSKRMPPKSGDIFFTREAPMGEAAIVPDGERVCLGQRSMLIRLFPDLFSNRFLLYVIQSPSFQARMAQAAIGMTVKHLRVGGVEDLVVPVPPKAEQDQIVIAIDKLFRVCDQYSSQLFKKLQKSSRLASSAIDSLTGITATTQVEEPMKAPQTELIASLCLGQAPDIKAQAPLATILARHQGQMPAKDLWQRFGGEIDAFYAQLKTEVAHGWIQEPAVAEVREVQAASAGA